MAGEYSDDTQLLLAVARACLAGNQWLEHLRVVELPFWPTYQRGGGRAALTACRAWQDSSPPWASTKAASYFAAGANGAAMRIAPHVLATATEDAPR